MAEEQGWEIVDCEAAGQELIAAVKVHILTQLTQSKPRTRQEALSYRKLRWDERCEKLFHHGWDLAANRFLTERCGTGSELTANSLRYAVALEEKQEQLPLMKLGPGWIYFYKAVGDELSSEVGFFKMLPNSSKMSPGQAQRTFERVSISLKQNQVLIVDGGTVIDWPTTGGGLALLRMIEKHK